MEMKNYNYFPLLRTRQAEMKALANTSKRIFQFTLPIIELTSSRRSKFNPDGKVEKNLELLSEEVGLRNWILDLTTEESFGSPQTERLLDPKKAFANWRSFVKEHKELGFYPVLHVYAGMPEGQLRIQVEDLFREFGNLAVRIPYSELASIDVVSAILEITRSPDNLLIIIDVGFVSVGRAGDFDNMIVTAIKRLEEKNLGNLLMTTVSSSFPSSVKDKGYGRDQEGEFNLEELKLTALVNSSDIRNRVRHGDYATVHPLKYPDMYGGWVPRIDVPTKVTCFYHRYRRDKGGYVEAARKVVMDKRYKSFGCWGNRQITLASKGQPEGLSPSHWIAVRINIHMENRYRFSK